MSLRVEGLKEVTIALRRAGDRVERGQLEYLRKVAKKIQERAQRYAPVDEGDLENAIVVTEAKEGRRITVFVGVDPERLGPGYTRYGERYDVLTHELMDSPHGAGTMRRGPLTQAKGPQAGGKYLQRAFDDYVDEIQREMTKIAQRAMER